jgi:hypothetical protein
MVLGDLKYDKRHSIYFLKIFCLEFSPEKPRWWENVVMLWWRRLLGRRRRRPRRRSLPERSFDFHIYIGRQPCSQQPSSHRHSGPLTAVERSTRAATVLAWVNEWPGHFCVHIRTYASTSYTRTVVSGRARASWWGQAKEGSTTRSCWLACRATERTLSYREGGTGRK